MLRAWWRFNHPWAHSLKVGKYQITKMDWHTISSIIPLDPDKWRYVSTYYPLIGPERDYHLVYNPTKNWDRHGYSIFWESKKMVIIQLSFFDYFKFRKYQRSKKKLVKQEKEREELKKNNEIKMMILNNAQKDINKMREQAAKEVEESVKQMRAAATSSPKFVVVGDAPGHLLLKRAFLPEIVAQDIDRYHSGDYVHWKGEQEKLKTNASQSEIDRLSNAWISLSQSAGSSYIESFTSH